MGAFLAYSNGEFSLLIFVLSILTAVSLQILSNLSNDYGDSIHGADSQKRKGPSRSVQSGSISSSGMKKAMGLFIFLSLIFGTALVLISFEDYRLIVLFEVLGALCIWASINYTAGKNPYGYRGLGDISVFIFFGIVAVLGSYFIQTTHWHWPILLPAISCGLLAVGVLNINNIRDIDSDLIAGKKSLAARMGRITAVKYHGFLLSTAVILLVIFTGIEWKSPWQWLFVLALPLLWINMKAVKNITEPMALDPYLKQLALSTSLIILLFGIGQIL